MTDRQRNCSHPKFRFKTVKDGVIRKCTKCKLKIKQVPNGLFGEKVKDNRRHAK